MFTEVDDKGFVTLTPRPEPYTYVFRLEEDVDVGPSPKYTVKVHKDQGVEFQLFFTFFPTCLLPVSMTETLSQFQISEGFPISINSIDRFESSFEHYDLIMSPDGWSSTLYIQCT